MAKENLPELAKPSNTSLDQNELQRLRGWAIAHFAKKYPSIFREDLEQAVQDGMLDLYKAENRTPVKHRCGYLEQAVFQSLSRDDLIQTKTKNGKVKASKHSVNTVSLDSGAEDGDAEKGRNSHGTLADPTAAMPDGALIGRESAEASSQRLLDIVAAFEEAEESYRQAGWPSIPKAKRAALESIASDDEVSVEAQRVVQIGNELIKRAKMVVQLAKVLNADQVVARAQRTLRYMMATELDAISGDYLLAAKSEPPDEAIRDAIHVLDPIRDALFHPQRDRQNLVKAARGIDCARSLQVSTKRTDLPRNLQAVRDAILQLVACLLDRIPWSMADVTERACVLADALDAAAAAIAREFPSRGPGREGIALALRGHIEELAENPDLDDVSNSIVDLALKEAGEAPAMWSGAQTQAKSRAKQHAGNADQDAPCALDRVKDAVKGLPPEQVFDEALRQLAEDIECSSSAPAASPDK
jgi:hypothetical protein